MDSRCVDIRTGD